jgi:phospho-N-acetylmuramoyl-pentapeptide-transferase
VVALFIAGGVSLIVALVGTPLLIRWLRAGGIGQPIHEDVHHHAAKAGTPTMGGVAIVGAASIGYGVAHVRTIFTRTGLLVMLCIIGSAAVGMADDLIKVRNQRNLGLTKLAKTIGTLTVAITFAVLATQWADVSTNIGFARVDSVGIHLGVVLWSVWSVLLIISASNAVNFTDGLDGLAGGSAAFAFATFTVIGFWQLRHIDIYHVPHGLDLAIVSAAMVGGCAGFLWWNAAPARIIMGDTGALAIGAGIAALALTEKVDLLLPIVGGLYVVEALSDIIQIVSFRAFHRRVFRMAPIHYHFELAGWPETVVVIRFWILSALCAGMTLGIFYADFLSLGRGSS